MEEMLQNHWDLNESFLKIWRVNAYSNPIITEVVMSACNGVVIV